MIDYLKIAQEYHGGRADGFLTDQPVGIKLAEDDYVRVRYDAKQCAGFRTKTRPNFFSFSQQSFL